MKESLFKVRQLPDGRLEYEDCRGRVDACAPHEIGARMAAVLAEPDLPPVERVAAGGYRVLDAIARNVLPPHVQPHVGPITALAMKLLEQIHMARQSAAQARARAYGWQPQPPPPHPPGPHASDHSAHRRGHRVG